MKNLVLGAILGASLVAGASSVAFAQTVEQVAPAKIEAADKKARAIKIVNVPSALIAYWLDPAHNPRPLILGAGELPQPTDKGAFDLPDGISQIVSIDGQNLVLIRGTSESLRQVAELIEILDQPLRQVQLEAQFVEMSKADFKTFGFDFSGSEEATPQIEFGFVRNNFTARLNALIAGGNAKIIWAPPVTAINALNARIISSAREVVDGKPVTVTNDYRITPTLNGDGTLTVSFKITENENNEADEIGRSTIANLHDGDAIALLGVISAQYHMDNRIAVVDTKNLRPTDPERVIVVFLTGRVIRSADETQK